MREIKFRAKTLKGKWVYGYFVHSGKGSPFIFDKDGEMFTVDEDTLGQFTGLKDKNGKEIYEGDVILSDILYEGEKCVGVVRYEVNHAEFEIDVKDCPLYIPLSYCEVLGNIHDNPEPHKESSSLIENLLDYLKNTTKEQRQKDWEEIRNQYPDENEDWSEVFREPTSTVEVKPEPHYRPFKNAEEVKRAIDEHGKELLWGSDKKKVVIIEYDDKFVKWKRDIDDESSSHYGMDWMLELFTFADGTPFGVKED